MSGLSSSLKGKLRAIEIEKGKDNRQQNEGRQPWSQRRSPEDAGRMGGQFRERRRAPQIPARLNDEQWKRLYNEFREIPDEWGIAHYGEREWMAAKETVSTIQIDRSLGLDDDEHRIFDRSKKDERHREALAQMQRLWVDGIRKKVDAYRREK